MTDGSGSVVDESSTTEIVSINAIRYRGYYYDEETKFYYLQSRYYNPEVGRFLNADGMLNGNGDVLGYNMFAYCGNNPVNYSDPSGCSWIVLAWVFVGVCTVVGGIIGACADEPLAEKSREAKKEEFEEKMPSKDKVPNTVPDYVPKGNSKQNTATETTEETKLSTKDRLNNIVIGASIGLAVGGSFVMLAAMPLAPILGLGITAKLMATGMLAFNIDAIVFAPFYSVDLEPIEWDEQ